MSTIDFDQLIKTMLDAMKAPLSEQWKNAKPFVKQETKSFAQNIQLIQRLKKEDKISKEQAVLHMSIQRGAFRVVLLTIEGLGILAVEAAINAAIQAIKGIVNTAVGWSIL